MLRSHTLSSVGYRRVSEADKHPALTWIPLRNSGHSERRTLFKETSELVAQKTRAAIDAGLSVILCIGETLEEREAGKCTQVVETQLQAVVQVTKEVDWRCVSCYWKKGLMTDACVILTVKLLLHTSPCGPLARAKSRRLLKPKRHITTSESSFTGLCLPKSPKVPELFTGVA